MWTSFVTPKVFLLIPHTGCQARETSLQRGGSRGLNDGLRLKYVFNVAFVLFFEVDRMCSQFALPIHYLSS